jgi:hypothetical protein
MNDLVKRLRDKYASPQDVAEAADRIEELQEAFSEVILWLNIQFHLIQT